MVGGLRREEERVHGKIRKSLVQPDDNRFFFFFFLSRCNMLLQISAADDETQGDGFGLNSSTIEQGGLGALPRPTRSTPARKRTADLDTCSEAAALKRPKSCASVVADAIASQRLKPPSMAAVAAALAARAPAAARLPLPSSPPRTIALGTIVSSRACVSETFRPRLSRQSPPPQAGTAARAQVNGSDLAVIGTRMGCEYDARRPMSLIQALIQPSRPSRCPEL